MKKQLKNIYMQFLCILLFATNNIFGMNYPSYPSTPPDGPGLPHNVPYSNPKRSLSPQKEDTSWSWNNTSSRDRTPSPKRKSPSPKRPSEPAPRYASWSDWWNGKAIVETTFTAPSNSIQTSMPSEATRGRSKEAKENINSTQSPQPSNTSMPNPLNIAGKALGNASDLVFGGSAQAHPLLIPALPFASETLTALIAASAAAAAAHKAKQDPLDSMPTRPADTQVTPTTQDSTKKEEPLFSMKTWLAKESEPLPTIPESPEVVTLHQVAKERPIDAALQAETVIAPALSIPESKPATNGSNLAKASAFQQLVKQATIKEKTSDAAISIPQPNIHNWEEPAPSNTRIEHKPGNTEIKTSRGNTNYTAGTNLLFYPITYVLGKWVDSMQPTPQQPRQSTSFDSSPIGYSAEEIVANRDFTKAYNDYQNGGRKSPTRRRYNALIETSKQVLELEARKEGSVPHHTASSAGSLIRKHTRELQREKKKEQKKTEKQGSSSSTGGNNSGKGPNKDPNRDPQKIIEDIKNVAELAKDAKNKVEEKARNWNEYFNTKSGQKFKNSFKHTGKQNPKDGAPICIFTDKSKETEMFKEGWHYAPDRMHGKANSNSSIAGDHFEVWDKKGNWMGVANLDGSKNHGKTAQAIAEGAKRKIQI